MSDTESHNGWRQPALLLSADEHDRLLGLAQADSSRHPLVQGHRLLDELDRADIVPHSWMPPGIVRMDSHIEYHDDGVGRVRQVQLVYPDRADISMGRISVLSPVGTALIGLAAGQSITWATRSGRPRRLTVMRVGDKPFAEVPSGPA
ncbi:MAG: nucleoside diphosphate kinase regulator [Acetobacteraceae bacterium]